MHYYSQRFRHPQWNIFVDLLEPYSKNLNQKIKEIAQKNNILLHEGIYAAVLGPQLETRAEYRMLQILEADAVGMSTAPEVIVAKQLNLPCAAISVLTDECDPKNLQPVNIAQIIAIAGEAGRAGWRLTKAQGGVGGLAADIAKHPIENRIVLDAAGWLRGADAHCFDATGQAQFGAPKASTRLLLQHVVAVRRKAHVGIS